MVIQRVVFYAESWCGRASNGLRLGMKESPSGHLLQHGRCLVVLRFVRSGVAVMLKGQGRLYEKMVKNILRC